MIFILMMVSNDFNHLRVAIRKNTHSSSTVTLIKTNGENNNLCNDEEIKYPYSLGVNVAKSRHKTPPGGIILVGCSEVIATEIPKTSLLII